MTRTIFLILFSITSSLVFAQSNGVKFDVFAGGNASWLSSNDLVVSEYGPHFQSLFIGRVIGSGLSIDLSDQLVFRCEFTNNLAGGFFYKRKTYARSGEGVNYLGLRSESSIVKFSNVYAQLPVLLMMPV
ncbi:hypothetical protein [Persicobacter sp. CCB-QB2]|uniref:hypothetical protein n=1 Tax=Persicobacter sp. CCB-QB2 TaxID=1561025 RepID=UPI0012FADC9B|nr:hypothetical protein [Persicobacter sp. CCB-QB2]